MVADPATIAADGYGSRAPADAPFCPARCLSTSDLIWLYCSWNSRPSRFSHSISDGVKGRGTKEVPSLGFGEEVEAEAEGFLPVAFEGFAMFVPQILAGLRPQRKDLAPAAGAQGRRRDDVAARRLDVAPQICQRSAEADVIVHEDIELAGHNASRERRLERQPEEARRACVANRVGLDDLARHGEAEALSELVRHGVRDEVDARRLDGAHRQSDAVTTSTAQRAFGLRNRCALPDRHRHRRLLGCGGLVLLLGSMGWRHSPGAGASSRRLP